MGEIADMMLNGEMCEGCGEWLGDPSDPNSEGQGFPGLCPACAAAARRDAAKAKKLPKKK